MDWYKESMLNKIQQSKGNNCMQATHVKIMLPGSNIYLVVRAHSADTAVSMLYADVHCGLYQSYYSDPSEVKASDKIKLTNLPVLGFVGLKEMDKAEHEVSGIQEKLDEMTKDKDYWYKRYSEKGDQNSELTKEIENLRAELTRFEQARDSMLGATEPTPDQDDPIF